MNIPKTIYYIAEFIVFYIIRLVQSNIYIAYDILTPKMHTNPGLIKVPITLKSDIALLLFSNLVSMTPGTLSIDITEDKKYLWVHVLYKKSEEGVLNNIQEIQERIIRIFK